MHNKKIEIAILLCLLLFFSIPSTLGIYKNIASSSKSINTADWDVSLNQTGINGSITTTVGSSNGTDYTLKLVSNSEVDVTYTITVSNIPSGVVVKLNGDASYTTPSNGTATFPNAGVINYTGSSEEVTRTLTFRANSGATLVSNQSVTIDVDFKQN